MGKATVLLTQTGIASLTQAQYNTLASWGIGAIVVGSNSGGGASWPSGFGGSAAFNGGGGGTTQTNLKAAAVLAHNAGIQVYLGIYLQNNFWGTQVTTNPAPCLGSWDPSYIDAHGNGYGTTTTTGSWAKMCFDYGAAVAVMNLDGMFWDTEGGGIGPSSNDFVTWQWRNFTNNYGATSSQAQQNGWAQTAGALTMASINAGFQSQGGNSVISGNQVPITMYLSTVAGLPLIQNGYLDLTSAFTSTTVGVFIHGSGTVQESYHTAIGTSTFASFLAGVASATTGPVIMGDSTFYWQGIVTSGNIYSADVDGGWTRALAAQRSALAALGLGANVAISPFIWPYDATGANGGGGIWTQAQWNKALGPILSGLQGGMYMIFGFTALRSGTTLVANYANNTSTGGSGQNYTPLVGTLGTASLSGTLTVSGVASATPGGTSATAALAGTFSLVATGTVTGGGSAGVSVYLELTGVLNQLAGTSHLEAAGAANAYAGTKGLELVGALNRRAGTNGLEMDGVCNKLAGTTGLGAVGALNALAGNS